MHPKIQVLTNIFQFKKPIIFFASFRRMTQLTILKKLGPLRTKISAILPLNHEIQTYYKIIEFGNHNYTLLNNDRSMKRLYKEFDERKHWSPKIIFDQESKLHDFLHFVWKSHPVDYFNKKFLSEETFLNSIKKQTEFCVKFKEHISQAQGDPKELDESWIDYYIEVYLHFLFFAKKNENIIVPTLEEDFVWHSHMNNPPKYQYDMNLIFEYLLDHNDSINDEKLIEMMAKRRQVDLKFGKIKKGEKNDVQAGGGCSAGVCSRNIDSGSSQNVSTDFDDDPIDPIDSGISSGDYLDFGGSGDSGSSCGSSCGGGCGGGD